MLFRSELDRETARSRKVLHEMPEGHGGWKPHDKSMTFGYLAELVATMPGWIAMQVTQAEFDVAPVDGQSQWTRTPKITRADYLAALDEMAGQARRALDGTSDAHLETRWRLKAGGHVVQEDARHTMIQDTLNHWSHHRGQMTVYLRLDRKSTRLNSSH